MLPKIAIIGATGIVGRTLLKVLEEFNVKAEYTLFASKRSEGAYFHFFGSDHVVMDLETNYREKAFDYAVFVAGSEISKKYVPLFIEQGTKIIDNSSCFRKNKNVPLIAFGVNEDIITKSDMLIANPNCSTIQAVNVLKPLHDFFKIKRLVYTTMQSVSGAGKQGINALELGNDYVGKVFPYPIASNCIPKIGNFLPDGYTEEEEKLISETKKILNDENIEITATAVRVPTYIGHAISVNVEFYHDFTKSDITDALLKSNNVEIIDDNDFPTNLDVYEDDGVFVGRIRRDFSVKSGLNMFIVANNLRRGASTNAVQILNYLINNYG